MISSCLLLFVLSCCLLVIAGILYIVQLKNTRQVVQFHTLLNNRSNSDVIAEYRRELIINNKMLVYLYETSEDCKKMTFAEWTKKIIDDDVCELSAFLKEELYNYHIGNN